MLSNITKTTAITNSKQSPNSKVGIDELSNVNVGLPKIKSKQKQLASIDDDYEEEYDERMPSKPKGVSQASDEEVGSDKALQRNDRSRSKD
mmetsp:Transcript_25549/g.31905  ORF Transcript_25549/g.31905 Transcript_25549/m.31905 type:complete len:91 (+) Transcript_25549:86-358(+)